MSSSRRWTGTGTWMRPNGTPKKTIVACVASGQRKAIARACSAMSAAAGSSITCPVEATMTKPIFRLDRHVIAPGLYVSITEEDGIQRPFKIAAVTPVRT